MFTFCVMLCLSMCEVQIILFFYLLINIRQITVNESYFVGFFPDYQRVLYQ